MRRRRGVTRNDSSYRNEPSQPSLNDLSYRDLPRPPGIAGILAFLLKWRSQCGHWILHDLKTYSPNQESLPIVVEILQKYNLKRLIIIRSIFSTIAQRLISDLSDDKRSSAAYATH